MIKSQALPQYLPAVDRQLEHQAGLLADKQRVVVNGQQPLLPAKQWLGIDFNDIIVVR